ncbi:PREDICTED: uncharacterized protein LOC108759435 [Trachymyrmex cornetzi]|uniref:uncharacterized protein LOC108759435 n=1 Tax=Trachymyrmex cornetzi TaxID=471704 RepID=UPI00084F1FF8|nr:PREDICTED: uncharacterized protein LOC108759435 [Trachymyrmex cornetzi]
MPQINNLLLHVIAQVQLRRLLIVALLISKKRNYRKKRFWTSQFLSQRKTHGAYYTTIPTLLRNADLFSNYCRMSKTQFEDLLTLIGSQITKQTFIREPISPDQRLFLTLRYLASGDSMMSLKYQYYVAQSTITNIIKETCNVLWSMLMPIVLKVPTHDTWKQIAKKFELNCHFPHCIGAVDGKHVVIQAPPNSGSTFYNYKSSHSIVLMAGCDSDYKFVLVDIGATGRQSDGGIWSRSIMGQAFAEDETDIPPPDEVIEGTVLPYVLVADEAFQLTDYMMRPFPGKGGLTKEKGVFNYRLSRARNKSECTFGILTAQWRIYKRPINTSIEIAESIVKATIVLHNFLRQNDNDDLTEFINVVDVPTCSEIRTTAFSNIGNFGSNTHTREASRVRNIFVNYFNNEGALP